jgi:hypothetical protein
MSALAPQLPQRPPAVVFAVCLVGVNAAAIVVRLAVMYTQPPPRPLLAEFLCLTVITGLGALWVYGLWRGRNWLRWVTIAYGVGNVLAVPRALTLFHGPALPIFLIEVALTTATAALLLLPPATTWYRSRASTSAVWQPNNRWRGP